MYRGAQSAQKNWGAMAFPPAQAMTISRSVSASATLNHISGLLTSRSVDEGLLGLSSDVPGEHEEHGSVASGEGLHEDEGDEESNSGLAGRLDSDENNRADHVQTGESAHCEEGVVVLPDEEARSHYR